jgi:pyrroline-5-carboxylate reductase
MKTESISFIGGGRITRIFLQAFENKKVKFKDVIVVDPNEETVNALKKEFPFVKSGDLATAANQSIVFIALHPPLIMEALGQIARKVNPDTLVISLAPKITIEKISSVLNIKNIARMIPNATSYMNEGYNPVTFSKDFDISDKMDVLELLALLGNTFEVEEQKLEAYAILSAMLPTYFWFQWDALSKMGLQMGLTEDESRESVKKTIDAANKIFFESTLSPKEVMDLIPVKPIGENQDQITEIYQTKLSGLYAKIKP